MKFGLTRMIRAAADRVPLIRAMLRNAGAPFRPARSVVRGAGRAQRIVRAAR